ncbi:MAG: MBOAT family O-acyltransferase [Paenibacillaceae bacterium]
MYFHSGNFFIFFIALIIPFLLLRKRRALILAIANAVFYAVAGIGPLFQFFLMTLITFAIVHVMQRPKLRWLFYLGIILNLFNLAFFKYFLLAISTLESMTGVQFLHLESYASTIILPLGISFYTFEFISYLIDVRRGHTKPTKSLISFWVFVSMFPHLIAGPIMRGDELIPQLEQLKEKRIGWQEIKYGVYLFMIGLCKKLLLADPLAQIADRLFAHPESLSAVDSWIAAYTFCFQIYFDFSAYSDMALGLGYILGVKLMINFNTPYLSNNPTEFWRRWHITLSRWIKDYIYIGLGGNRRGVVRAYINLFAAMVLSGLWHGAMWTFVLWGAIHGAALMLHKLSLGLNRWPSIASIRKSWIYRVVTVIIFFQWITWTWVFFRVTNIQQAFAMSRRMLHVNIGALLQHPSTIWIALLLLLHLVEYLLRHNESAINRWWHDVPFPLRGASYACLTFVLIYFMQGETYNFIYFQF